MSSHGNDYWRKRAHIAERKLRLCEEERDRALEAAQINATNLHEVREDLLAENNELRAKLAAKTGDPTHCNQICEAWAKERVKNATEVNALRDFERRYHIEHLENDKLRDQVGKLERRLERVDKANDQQVGNLMAALDGARKAKQEALERASLADAFEEGTADCVMDLQAMTQKRDNLARACDAVGKWLSAAQDDPKVCDDMKSDIATFFKYGEFSICYSCTKGPQQKCTVLSERQRVDPDKIIDDCSEYNAKRTHREALESIQSHMAGICSSCTMDDHECPSGCDLEKINDILTEVL